MRSVTYYTHVASDDIHSTEDNLALVLKDNEDGCLELVVFPVGGPVFFTRACAWDDEAALPPPGGSYWRDEDTDPPDFGQAYRWYNDQRYQDLLRNQQVEMNRTPEKDREGLTEQHWEEQQELMEKLDSEKEGQKEPDSKSEPDPAPEPDPVVNNDNTNNSEDRR